MKIRACSSCFSIEVYPYMGFETGRKYHCKSCGIITPVIVEFDTIDAYRAFLEASG